MKQSLIAFTIVTEEIIIVGINLRNVKKYKENLNILLLYM